MRHHGKRSWRTQEDEQPEVDDLQVAATFALQLPGCSSPQGLKEEDGQAGEPNNMKDPETGSTDPRESESGDDSSKDKESTSDKSDQADSDDESEVDLTEALARMQDESEDEQGAGRKSKKESGSSIIPPTTEHEVDPYHIPVAELESNFHLNLTVAEQDRLQLMNADPIVGSKDSNTMGKMSSVQLREAGSIKSYMVSERTLVIESERPGTSPLDEGSLLVIRVKAEVEGNETQHRLVPLGKVLEVFGPVSRPLYSIRLPTVAGASKRSPSERIVPEKEMEIKETDDDEIPLTDSDPENGSDVANEVENYTCASDDPWAEDGVYSKLIRSSTSMPVFYIPEITNILDTGRIMQNSRKGCDASNLYDEEVVNVHEVDFSDDEKEREFKNRRRGKKGSKANGGRREGHRTLAERTSARCGPRYTGFHDAQSHRRTAPGPSAQVPHAQPYAYSQHPYTQGEQTYQYPQPMQSQFVQGYPMSTQYTPPFQQQFYNASPSNPSMQPQYAPQYPQRYPASQPPPPPPPPVGRAGGPNGKSQSTQSGSQPNGDTVYYDYS